MADAPAPQITLDEMAAEMASNMDLGQGRGRPIMKSGAHEIAKGGGLGDMPGSRPGSSGAEGGFTPQAGGTVIDQTRPTQKGEGAPSAAEMVAKAGAYTGGKTNMEPGRQGKTPYTGGKTTMEPKGEIGGGSGEGGNLTQAADDDSQHRQRKAGKVGVSDGADGGQPGEPGLPQASDDDSQHRQRKPGKVGISKSVLETEIAKAQANLAALQQLAKANNDDEEDDEGERDEMAYGKGKGYKKSDADEVDADELVKALDILEGVAGGVVQQTPQERSAELAKGLDEGSLTSEQMVELAGLMKAEAAAPSEEPLVKGGTAQLEPEHELPEDPVDKSFQEEWAEDPKNQGDYDASPFLERFSQVAAAGLDQVQDRLSKGMAAQTAERRAFNTQLAKSLKFMAQRNLHQETLIKGLQDRLSQVENTPLPRAGASGAGALQKSVDGEVGAGQQLNYDAIGDALVDMSIKMERAPCGEDLRRAMADFEMSGNLSKSLYKDVVKFRHENQR